jgi:hypothetical protein
LGREPLAARLRARSKVILLQSNATVFRYMSGGSTMCFQSPEAWRTIRALVKAANDMVMAKIATQMPLRVAWACPCRSTAVAAGAC